MIQQVLQHLYDVTDRTVLSTEQKEDYVDLWISVKMITSAELYPFDINNIKNKQIAVHARVKHKMTYLHYLNI